MWTLLRVSGMTKQYSCRKKLEGHLEEHIPPPRNAWSTRTYRAQYIFEISCYTVLHRFWLYLSRVKNQIKKINNSRIQIWIRIFTKIESICPCDMPNLSTIFRPNPSTTLWDIMLYIGFSLISQWWRINFKSSSSQIRIFTKI